MKYKIYLQDEIIIALTKESENTLKTIRDFKGIADDPFRVTKEEVTLTNDDITKLKEGCLSFVEQNNGNLFFSGCWYTLEWNILKVNDEVFERVNETNDGIILDMTQWKTNLKNKVNIKNNQELNLFSIINNNDKLPVSTKNGFGKIDITTYPSKEDYIKFNYRDTKESITFRVTGEMNVNGGTKHFGIELRRLTDDSIIASSSITFKNNTTDDKFNSSILSYINDENDEFVINGCYITFVNKSGADIKLKNDISVLITRTYRKAIK